MIASLLRQLVLPWELPTDLLSTYKHCQLKNEGTPELNDLISLFIKYARQLPPIAVFFDAFDECHDSQHKDIRTIVEALLTAESKVFITTRPHVFDKLAFDNAITAEIRANDRDIENFIVVGLEDEGKGLDLEDSKYIARVIASQADGMYKSRYIT